MPSPSCPKNFEAPAVDDARLQQCAGVRRRSRDGLDVRQEPDARHSLHAGRKGAWSLGAVAEGAVLIEPPTTGRSVGLHRARVVLADRDPNLVAERAGARTVQHRVREQVVLVRVVAQRVIAVVTPAVDGGVDHPGARVVLPRRDLDDARERAGALDVLHRDRERAAGRGAVAQLSGGVVAPTVDAAARQERAGVVVAGHHLRHAGERRGAGGVLHEHRRHARERRAVPELTVVVHSRTGGGTVRHPGTGDIRRGRRHLHDGGARSSGRREAGRHHRHGQKWHSRDNSQRSSHMAPLSPEPAHRTAVAPEGEPSNEVGHITTPTIRFATPCRDPGRRVAGIQPARRERPSSMLASSPAKKCWVPAWMSRKHV